MNTQTESRQERLHAAAEEMFALCWHIQFGDQKKTWRELLDDRAEMAHAIVEKVEGVKLFSPPRQTPEYAAEQRAKYKADLIANYSRVEWRLRREILLRCEYNEKEVEALPIADLREAARLLGVRITAAGREMLK